MKIFFLALFSFLVGCSAPVEGPSVRTIPFSCSPELVDVCAEAIASWNEALEGRVLLTLSDRGWKVRTGDSNDHPCYGAESGMWAGCTTPGDITLDPSSWHGTDDPSAYRMGVLLHEMGHAIGLPDGSTADPDSVMYPIMRKRSAVDAETASHVPTI